MEQFDKIKAKEVCEKLLRRRDNFDSFCKKCDEIELEELPSVTLQRQMRAEMIIQERSRNEMIMDFFETKH